MEANLSSIGLAFAVGVKPVALFRTPITASRTPLSNWPNVQCVKVVLLL